MLPNPVISLVLAVVPQVVSGTLNILAGLAELGKIQEMLLVEAVEVLVQLAMVRTAVIQAEVLAELQMAEMVEMERTARPKTEHNQAEAEAELLLGVLVEKGLEQVVRLN